jgi:hypothetical protein
MSELTAVPALLLESDAGVDDDDNDGGGGGGGGGADEDDVDGSEDREETSVEDDTVVGKEAAPVVEAAALDEVELADDPDIKASTVAHAADAALLRRSCSISTEDAALALSPCCLASA